MVLACSNPRPGVLALVFVALMLVGTRPAGAVPWSPEGLWLVKSWSLEQGLPHAGVECLLQTRDGFLWVGTRNGIARFDGIRFRVFDETSPGFTSDASMDLAEDTAGRLWIATKRGIYRQDATSFTRVGREQGLLHDSVRRIHPAADGALWLATGGGLARWLSGRIEALPFAVTNLEPGPRRVVRHHVECVLRDGKEGLWVGLADGLTRFEPESRRWTRVWPTEESPTNTASFAVRDIVRDARGALWFGTDRELIRQVGAGFQVLPLPPAYGDIRLRRLRPGVQDPGKLWVVRAGVLHRIGIETGTLERFDAVSGLNDRYVTEVLEDSEGTLWVGTRFGGLFQLREPRVRILTTLDGLPHNTVASVSAARTGGVWVATGAGAALVLGNRGSAVDIEGDRPARGSALAIEDSGGNLWLTDPLQPGACYERKEGRFRVRGGAGQCGGASVAAEDHDGRVWFATDRALMCGLPRARLQVDTSVWRPTPLTSWVHWWVYQPSFTLYHQGFAVLEVSENGWRYETPAGPEGHPAATPVPAVFLTNSPAPFDRSLPFAGVRCLKPGPDGALWVGTRTGALHRLRDGIATPVAASDWDAGRSIQTLHFDETGALWVGTSDGLALLNGDRLRRVAGPKDLPDSRVYQVESDGNGYLWVGTGRGLCRLPRSELVRRLGQPEVPVEVLTLDEADGMLTSDLGDTSQPGSCRTADGRLWFASVQGLAVVNPGSVRRDPQPPPVFIDLVRSSDGVTTEPGPDLELKPGSGRHLEIGYTALGFAAPERLRFRYRLLGHDPGWKEAGARRTAYFTNLRPGSYRFEVLAGNRDAVWSPAPAVLGFRLKPRLHEMLAFRVGMGVLALAGLAVVHHLRLRATQAAERAELARSLHDQLAGKLAALAKLADQAAVEPAHSSAERRPAADPGPDNAAGNPAATIAALARNALRTLRHTIALGHPGAATLSALVQQLVEVAEEIVLPVGLSLRFEVPLESPDRTVRALIQEHVRHIVSEALNNVVKHSQARRVVLRVRFHPEPLVVEIEDDGLGMAGGTINSPAAHGVAYMRTRARAIQADLTIASQADRGTRLCLAVPRL